MHLAELVAFLLNWRDANPNGSKKVLAAEVLARTDLKLDKALLVGKHCVLRISQMQEVGNDSSAVAAFRKIEEYDDRPIVVCLFTSRGMRLLLANSTFLEKVSDRSYRLTSEHLAGSIFDSDILAAHEGIANLPANFDKLWAVHLATNPADNLSRIVGATKAMHAQVAAANPGRVRPPKAR